MLVRVVAVVVFAVGAVVRRPLGRLASHVVVSVCAGVILLLCLGCLVGRGCLQFMLRQFVLSSSCIGVLQCKHLHTGVAESVRRVMVGRGVNGEVWVSSRRLGVHCDFPRPLGLNWLNGGGGGVGVELGVS